MGYVVETSLDAVLEMLDLTPTALHKTAMISSADRWINTINEKFGNTVSIETLEYYATQKAIALLGAALVATRLSGEYPIAITQAIKECDEYQQLEPSQMPGGINQLKIVRGTNGW